MLRSFSGAGKTRWEETSCMQTPGSLVSQPSGLSSPCLDQALHTATSTGIKVKMMLFIFGTSHSTSNCYCLCFCGSVVQTFSFCFHPNLAVQLGVNLFVNLGRKYLTKGGLFLFISPPDWGPGQDQARASSWDSHIPPQPRGRSGCQGRPRSGAPRLLLDCSSGLKISGDDPALLISPGQFNIISLQQISDFWLAEQTLFFTYFTVETFPLI